MQYDFNDTSLSGIFPNWREPVTEYMKKAMKGLAEASYINDRNIKNMDREYIALLAGGSAPPEIVSRVGNYGVKWTPASYALGREMAAKLNIPLIVILNYFLAIYDLSKSGAIDFKHYDPAGVKAGEQSRRELEGKKWYESLLTTAKITGYMIPLLLVAGSVFGLMYLSKEVD